MREGWVISGRGHLGVRRLKRDRARRWGEYRQGAWKAAGVLMCGEEHELLVVGRCKWQ